MNFITLAITCDEEKRELLIAELSLFAFDAFEETTDGLLASCEPANWEEEAIKEILEQYQVAYQVAEVPRVNWNEEWEKHYDPVVVDDQCIVRATFHPARPEFPYEIIITPKMSFGTGHHATTWQVLRYQLGMDHAGKKVLDVGCGTGALAIMAKKRGAGEVWAVDIDDWCIENSAENFDLNQCRDIRLKLGGIEVVSPTEQFDVILANINKNVLLAQLEDYSLRLKPSGTLVLSGFYTPDIPDLLAEAQKWNLQPITQSEKDKWAMLVLSSVV